MLCLEFIKEAHQWHRVIIMKLVMIIVLPYTILNIAFYFIFK